MQRAEYDPMIGGGYAHKVCYVRNPVTPEISETGMNTPQSFSDDHASTASVDFDHFLNHESTHTSASNTSDTTPEGLEAATPDLHGISLYRSPYAHSNSTLHYAPSEPTMPTTLGATRSTGVLNHRDLTDPKSPMYAGMEGIEVVDHNILPELRNQSTGAAAASHDSEETMVHSLQNRIAAQPELLDNVHVENNNFHLDPHANLLHSNEPSINGLGSSANSIPNAGLQSNRKATNQSVDLRILSAAPSFPSNHSTSSSQATLVNQTSSAKSKTHVLSKIETNKLFPSIRDLRDKDRSDDKDTLRRSIKDLIIKFYKEHAYGPNGPDANSILRAIIDHDLDDDLVMIVDQVDAVYAKAGWHLKYSSHGQELAIQAVQGTSLPQHHTNKRSTPHRLSTRQSVGSGREVQSAAKRPRPSPAIQQLNSAPTTSPCPVLPVSNRQRYQCEFCTNVSGDLKKWKAHYDTHWPQYFWACIIKNCDFVACRQESVYEHYKSHEPLSDSIQGEILRNKFEIADGGHERCIYSDCDKVFPGKDSAQSRKHIASHYKNKEKAAQLQFEHRCGQCRSGKKDSGYHWKDNPLVQVLNRVRPKVKAGTEVSSRGDGSEVNDGSDRSEMGGGNPPARENGGSATGYDGRSHGVGGEGTGSRGMGGGRTGGDGRGPNRTREHIVFTGAVGWSCGPSISLYSDTSYGTSPKSAHNSDSTMYAIDRFVSEPAYGVGGFFIPSKSNVSEASQSMVSTVTLALEAMKISSDNQGLQEHRAELGCM